VVRDHPRFGAVLLGIADDYGIHVYFALRGRRREPATVLKEVSAPICFAGATILGAFAAPCSRAFLGNANWPFFALVALPCRWRCRWSSCRNLLLPSVDEVKAAPRAHGPPGAERSRER